MEISGIIKECKRAELKLNYVRDKTNKLKQLAKDLKNGVITQKQVEYQKSVLDNTVVDFGGVFENLSYYLNNKTKKIILCFLEEKNISKYFEYKKKEELKGNLVLDVVLWKVQKDSKNTKKINEVVINKIDLCDDVVLFDLKKEDIKELKYIEDTNKKIMIKH